MDESKPLEEIKTWEHPPWDGIEPIQGESNIDFLGESEGSLPQPQDSFPDAREALNDFWSMSGNFIYHHHVEPRVKLYSPREESFPIPLKYIDASRTTRTNLDVMQERHIDDQWNVDPSRDFVWFFDRFHSVYSIFRRTSRRTCLVLGETHKTASDIQARTLKARALDKIAKECPAEGEAKMVRWKTETRQCTKITRNLFHWPWGQGVQRHH